GVPRSLAIDPADGSVLLTDSGDSTANPANPARIFRIPAGARRGARPLQAFGGVLTPTGADDMPSPMGIVVAQGLAGIPDGTLFVADSMRDTVLRIVPGSPRPARSAIAAPSVDGAWDLQVYDAGDPSPYFVADA